MSNKIDIMIIDDIDVVLADFNLTAKMAGLKTITFNRHTEAITFLKTCENNSLPMFYLVDLNLEYGERFGLENAKEFYLFLKAFGINMKNVFLMTYNLSEPDKQLLNELGKTATLKGEISDQFFKTLKNKTREVN